MQQLLAVNLALKSLRRNRLRTILTVLGIVIGIIAVIVMMSVGQGLKKMLAGQLETFGSNMIQTETRVPSKAKRPTDSASAQAMGVTVTTMKNSDIEAIRKLPNILEAYGGQMSQEQLTYLDTTKRSLVFGVSATYLNVDKDKVEHGRFFEAGEEASAAQVVLLAPDVAKRLFGQDDPLEKNIKVRNLNFRVIGWLAKRGSVAFFNMDDRIVIPLKTMQDKLMGVDYVSYITAAAQDMSKADETAEDIRVTLRQRHDITDPDKDDFEVQTMAEAMKTIDTVMNAITWLLLGIAAISLLVGGVGISNIMYVSIKERTYEIGLRKALGAKSQDILWQFLWEAIVITLLGGIIGIVLGLLFSLLVTLLLNLLGYAWPVIISWSAILVSFVLSSAVGLIFGVYPARQAAKLSPVEALRYE